ncbi:MAG TPA: hypothetical protein VFE96_04420, partial [Candidatus Bathyarchaeia archaeon]|nr:hypothetical protein [Candidatus Bathyarchaeia archaeon]
LAIGVYNPLRQDIFRWVETEPNYNDQWAETWKSLKRSQLHLLVGVPDSIITLLDRVEPDITRANFLKTKMTTIIQELLKNIVQESYPKASLPGEPYSYVFVRAIVGGKFVRTIDPAIMWLSRKNVKDYLNEYVSKQYEGETWKLELVVGNLSLGQMEAEDFCKKFMDSLEGNVIAEELRDRLESISTQGKALNPLIEAELKRH